MSAESNRRRAGERRGIVRELADALMRGPQAVRDWAFLHAIPVPHCGCWLWDGPTNNAGYGYIVDPRKPQNRCSARRVIVSRLVCEVTTGPMPHDIDTRHRCDVPLCIHPDHVERGTRAQNNNDKIMRGRDRPSRGEHNGRAVVSAEVVRQLRSQFRPNTVGECGRYAAALGIAESTVRKIVSGATWAHVSPASLG